jgi:hypothetical protein
MTVKQRGVIESSAFARSKGFHVTHDGETTRRVDDTRSEESFWQGFLLGLLVGEGHFGGDGRQPQVTLRMHTRHALALRRLTEIIPGSRLYGPYNHGGRQYLQWMARGEALRLHLLPLLDSRIADLDDYAHERYCSMLERYGLRQPNAELKPGDDC